MTHLLIALWLTAIGVIASAPASGWLSPLGTAAVAPAVGAALYVVAGVLLAVAGLFSVVWSLVAATIAGLIVLAAAKTSSGTEIRVRTLLVGAGWAFGLTTVVAIVALHAHAARFTEDSFGYLMSASSLQQTGGLDGIDSWRLVFQQLAVPVVQATGWAAGDGYSPVLGPLFGAATLATIGWVATRAMKRGSVSTQWQTVLLTTAGLLLMTTNRFVFNLNYINGHMLFAMLLLIAVGLTWLGIVEGDHRFLYLAGIAFAAAAITRAESLIVIAVFLIPILADRHLSTPTRLVIALPAATLAAVWFGVVLPRHAPGSDVAMGALYGNAAIAAFLALFALIAGICSLRRLIELTPWAMLGGAILLLAFYIDSDPQLILASLGAIGTNVAYWGFWGFFWYVVPPLVVAAMIQGRVAADRLWNFGIAGFFLTLPLMAYLRGGAYRAGSGDSANRMLLHIVPLLVVYLVIAGGRASVDLPGEPEKSTGLDSVRR